MNLLFIRWFFFQFEGRGFEYHEPVQTPIAPPYEEVLGLLDKTVLGKPSGSVVEHSSLEDFKKDVIEKNESLPQDDKNANISEDNVTEKLKQMNLQK